MVHQNLCWEAWLSLETQLGQATCYMWISRIYPKNLLSQKFINIPEGKEYVLARIRKNLCIFYRGLQVHTFFIRVQTPDLKKVNCYSKFCWKQSFLSGILDCHVMPIGGTGLSRIFPILTAWWIECFQI